MPLRSGVAVAVVTVAPIQTLAQELPCAAHVAHATCAALKRKQIKKDKNETSRAGADKKVWGAGSRSSRVSHGDLWTLCERTGRDKIQRSCTKCLEDRLNSREFAGGVRELGVTRAGS